MSVAKVIELSATSNESFEDAIQQGVARASKTLKNVQGAWIKEQQVNIENGRISRGRCGSLLKKLFAAQAREPVRGIR